MEKFGSFAGPAGVGDMGKRYQSTIVVKIIFLLNF